MRLVNKKWIVENKSDHILLRWRDYEVLIDNDDFHYFEEFRLRILQGTTVKGKKIYPYVYLVHIIDGKYKYETFHRVITNCHPDLIVDHINGNTLDNRKKNLRIITSSYNLGGNSTKRIRNGKYTSLFKGVSFKKGNRKKPWVSNITKNGKKRWSYHLTELEAALQYNKWAVELYGDTAILNKIPNM